MATEINDADKVQLLFKQFTGVVNAKQQDPFPVESFAFKNYILNNNILSDNIPTTLPLGWRSSDLDGSSNIANGSVTNLASIGYPQLSFHKKRDLSGATFGSLKTWFITDGSGGSALKNAISFKNDPISNSYNYSVYQKINSSVFSPVNMYTNPTFWLFDFKSGFLEFYGDEDDLNGTNTGSGGIDLTIYPPVISFFQYVGATGGGGGGGGGDASYNNIEVQGNNLMQSVTIQPWPEPNPSTPNMTLNYVIATVDISGNSEMSLGYFTLQLGHPYKQVISFYAGVIENKGAFIKIISCTNEETFNGFKNLKIISYDGTCYLVSTFGRASGGAGDPDLLKIILVNNNANSDNPTNNPDWILRDNPDEDWLSNGPNPPETKMPWTVGPPPYPVPTLPPALVTVSLLQNDGQPYGVSTQPEYFQNNIVLDTSANILAGENGTGTIDICGGLYVDRDASFNMDVHVRSSVDISGGLTVDSSGTFGGNLFAANTPMIEYIRYDNNNFASNSVTPSINGSWQTIAQIYPISPLSAQVDTRAAYAIFEIVDRSNNNTSYNFQDNITCMISYTTEECTLNVLSSNPTGNTTGLSQKGYVGNIRLQCGDFSLGGGSLPSANLQIKRFCDDTGTGTTDVRVRMYHNFQPMLMPREFTPFVLTSTSLSLTGTITNTEFDVLNYASGFKSSTTKRQYVDKSTMGSLNMEGDISMGTNNIVNANIISKGNSNEPSRIELSTSGINLLLDDNTTNHKITLGDETDTNKQIYMRVNPDVTLDMNSIEISKVNKITSDQTIDICANNIIIGVVSDITIDASNIDLSANTYNIDIRDGDMKIQQDISTNEIWIKNIGGSGYITQRQNDAGVGAGGWPSSSSSAAGNNTIIKAGRWVDMGGLAPVNMFTLPTTNPWNLMADSGTTVIQDGRSLIGMNLRSTFKYFLKREAQGNLQMGDFQVRQKSARFYDQTETWADASLNTDGDIGFVETSSLSNKSFVYYGNSDVITMKNPMTLQFSSMYAYGAGGTGGWAAANWDLQSGGGSITDNQPSSTSEGSLVFTKVGSGGFGAASPTWYCDQAFSPGSGFMNKLGPGKENDPFMIQSRNNTPQSGWIVGFIISEGGLNTTFTTATNGSGSSPFGTIAFDIITGSISTPTVVAPNIHYYDFSNGSFGKNTNNNN